MRRYLVTRLAQMLLTYFLFLTMVYFLIDAQPGDFGNSFINDPKLTAEQRQILRERLGLDQPTYVRYAKWLSRVAQGDFGISFSNYPRPVLDVIAERAPRTITLFLSASIVSFYFGFMAGKLLAWQRGGWLEYVATVAGVGLYTVFYPWFGLMIIMLFSYLFGWFPIGKFIDPVLWRSAEGVTANAVFLRMILSGILVGGALFFWSVFTHRLDPIRRTRTRWIGSIVIFILFLGFWMFFSGGMGRYALDIAWHLVLPIVTLTLVAFAGQMLLTRNSMLETLREDYIMTARAKGLPEKVVRDKHAARNAMLPVITAFVFSLAATLDGGVITETVFSWPGMGLTLLTAATTEDIPMAIGALVFTGGLALTAHLVADVLYAYLDPRIRYA